MSFFGSLTGSDQRKDMRRGYAESTAILENGYGDARTNLKTGYDAADKLYSSARGDVNAGYDAATRAVGSGVGKAVGQYQPWITSGTGANAMYSNALGINGKASQQNFMRGYESGDPFRSANADFANNALMQVMNARGLSGSGTAAAAIAQESLRRGSQDYENYLNRLAGVSNQGLGAAGNVAQIYAGQGDKLSSLAVGRGSDLANITGKRADLGYGYGAANAGLDTELATTKAGNRINLANSMANSRGILGNNLMSLMGLGVQAFGGGGGGGAAGLAKMIGG